MMESGDWLSHFTAQMIARPSGPFGFRFVLQPAMAAFFAVMDGLADARAGRTPYFWLIVTDSTQRWTKLKEGATRVGRVLGFAVVMDVLYQLLEWGTIHPLETIVIALVLAFLPYLLIRGPANRIARWWLSHHAGTMGK